MLALLLASCVAQAAPAVPEAAAALARGDAAHAALDYGAARRDYERALGLDPASVGARARLAHVLNDLGEEKAANGGEAEARALLEAALAIAESLQSDAPDRPEGHHAVAATLGSLTPFLSGPGKVGAARRIDESARRATELEPGNARYKYVYDVAARELGNGRTAFLAGVPDEEDGIRHVFQAVEGDGTAAREHQDERHAGFGEHLEQFHLRRGQADGFAVAAVI